MTNFCAKAYTHYFGVVLWINLIGTALFCAYLGKGDVNIFSPLFGFGSHVFIGFILGLICGLLENIFIGGLIAVFLRINKNLETLVELNGGESNGGVNDELKKYREKEGQIQILTKSPLDLV
ncbi:hypothetical protein AGMMS49938_17880 [Fibrobacterales bacterium]|nr:hypothetical protein AGMMS49938_17880 [Fibrobacterales bacterium]